MLSFDNVYCMDCIEGIKKIKESSIDIIIVDPPYNIGKDFGNNQDNLPLNEYIEWSKKWLKESFRVLKPNGTIYIYGFPEILAHISVNIDINKQRWLVWYYTNKNVPGFNFWQRSHESILACWKEKPIFNRDDVREPYTESFLKNSAGKIRNGTKSRFGRNGKETTYIAHENGALPRDVINISTLAGGASLKERAIYCKNCKKIISPSERHLHDEHDCIIHPTQKPLSLCDKLIKAARPKNENFTVLVPFLGSGSECISTLKNNGHFIGFDINQDYVTLSKERLKSFVQKEVLDPQMSFL